MRLFSTLAPTALAASIALLAAPAAADLPPPDGTKFVGFAVVVDNLAAFADRVLVAYPWSMSNGAPTTEHAQVKNGEPLGIGRRSPTPKLWSVAKADYDSFIASYKPSREYQDPALDAFFKSDKVVACNATVSPEFSLPSSDARDTIVQRFHADAIDKAGCKLSAVASPTPPTSPASSGSPATADSAKPDGAPAASTPAGKTGCAGCAASSSGEGTAAGLTAFAVAALGIGIARRRRR